MDHTQKHGSKTETHRTEVPTTAKGIVFAGFMKDTRFAASARLTTAPA